MNLKVVPRRHTISVWCTVMTRRTTPGEAGVQAVRMTSWACGATLQTSCSSLSDSSHAACVQFRGSESAESALHPLGDRDMIAQGAKDALPTWSGTESSHWSKNMHDDVVYRCWTTTCHARYRIQSIVAKSVPQTVEVNRFSEGRAGLMQDTTCIVQMCRYTGSK
jgi:hypothetical protein